MTATDGGELLAGVWRRDAARLLAALARRLRDLDLAEDALAEAAARASERWPSDPPRDPAGWLYRTAWRLALDRLRARGTRRRIREASRPFEPAAPPSDSTLPEDRLGLFFLCAHPALSADSQAMLMLRLCAGLSTGRIARWFLTREDAVTRRLTRAKRRIRAAGLPFEPPPRAQWPERLAPVLATIEVLYDQAYAAADADAELLAYGRDARDLAATLADLLPGEPEVLGLAALLTFCESRRAARLDGAGRLVPLDRQDCGRWDRREIACAAAWLEAASGLRRPGPYQVRAAIHAAHARRAVLGVTPWHDIVTLYDALLSLAPSPAVHVNRAVALLHTAGAATAWEALEAAAAGARPEGSLAFQVAAHAVLERLGRVEAARDALERAIALASGAERAFLEAQRRAATGS